jgi:hypothetical protein
MFVARCRAENVNPFTKLLHLIATTDWSLCPPSPLQNHAPSELRLVCGHLQLHLHAHVPVVVHVHGSSKPSVTGGKFSVFSVTTEHHGFTLGTDDLLRWPPYLARSLEWFPDVAQWQLVARLSV